MSNYTPVSCELYDKLEAMATLHRAGEISYRTESGDTKAANAKIADVYAKDGADYCKLEDGTVIRLDRLATISVGDEKIW
ncbi:MAG: hypothetical protein WBA01_05415 [Phormidesmis sp.]